jgi:hypothetical protein
MSFRDTFFKGEKLGVLKGARGVLKGVRGVFRGVKDDRL